MKRENGDRGLTSMDYCRRSDRTLSEYLIIGDEDLLQNTGSQIIFNIFRCYM